MYTQTYVGCVCVLVCLFCFVLRGHKSLVASNFLCALAKKVTLEKNCLKNRLYTGIKFTTKEYAFNSKRVLVESNGLVLNCKNFGFCSLFYWQTKV